MVIVAQLVRALGCGPKDAGSSPVFHPSQLGGIVILRHIFEDFKISSGKGYDLVLNRCKICMAIKISIIEYDEESITLDDDGLYLRGTKYCLDKDASVA